MKHRALFLDRDGTLVHPRHYPSRPEDLVLYEGIGPELRRLQEAGFHVVVITNQSGIARGYFSVDDLQRMHDHLAEQLTPAGVRLDGVYYCPHHPDGVIHELAVACGCRKPEPGMLLQAAADLDLDLQRSWFLGDILDDVQAGNQAGCRTILIDLGTESRPTSPARRPDFVARDTLHALRIVGAVEGLNSGDAPALEYLPATWQIADATADGRRQIAGQEGEASSMDVRGEDTIAGDRGQTAGENGRAVSSGCGSSARGVVLAERGAHGDAG